MYCIGSGNCVFPPHSVSELDIVENRVERKWRAVDDCKEEKAEVGLRDGRFGECFQPL